MLFVLLVTVSCGTADRITNLGQENDQNQDNNTVFINDDSSTDSGGNITNDDNTTTGTIKIDAKNAYKVSVKFSDEYNEKGYYSKEEVGQLSFDITNIYTGKLVDTSIIEKITLKAEQLEEANNNENRQGTYLNFITFSGGQGGIYEIEEGYVKASDSVAIKMENLSGITNIILSVTLKDFDKPFNLKIPIVIEKNKSSSMAIVPIGSRYENGLFIDKYVIHVVDSYGNKAADNTRISTGVINNPKLYSNAYDTIANAYLDDRGILDKNNSTFTLPAASIDTTKDTITSLDTLIVLANQSRHKPENLGGWDIKSINSENELSIIDMDSSISPITDVSYVIGDEYRYIDYGQTIINAAASTFETTEIKDGLAYAELRYVPEMVGKNIFIYANTRLEDKHIGISRKILLHGTGLIPVTISCTNTNGLKPNCTRSVRIVQNDSGKGAHRVNISQPQLAGEAVYNFATASQTSDTGWTTVSIFNIDVNKTATVEVGALINNEILINQK
jgi:hypothetical protein